MTPVHAFNCAQPMRGGFCNCGAGEHLSDCALRFKAPCDCAPDLRTSGRGLTYDLSQLLGDYCTGPDEEQTP